jgi:dihydroorotase
MEIDDFHIHLRQGQLMEHVTAKLKQGGTRLAYVMPNLVPPICTTDQALYYQKQLQAIEPNVEFLMTLYLSSSLTPQEISKAAKAGIIGVKSYPKGVTTNSDGGIESYEIYYPVFEAMEKEGMVLNLHGEVPSDDNEVCVLNAEERFLRHLKKLHCDFPKLKIVLEHASTKAAVDMVKSCGETVGCTITIHHLLLTVDDWAGQCHNFCKPVAKFPHDRLALQQVILEGHERFFLGTDSAPHPKKAKESAKSAAGIYVSHLTKYYLAHALDSFGALERYYEFACVNGRKFYGLHPKEGMKVELKIDSELEIQDSMTYLNDNGIKEEIVPFMYGKRIKISKYM